MTDSEESDKSTMEGEHSSSNRIHHSLDSLLKQMEVTEEEKKYREENFENVDVIKDHEKDLVCTRCDSDFRETIEKGENVGVHPLLGVLMCDSCCDYYGDGNFSVDSEGEDKYCRWCGDGGTIFVCSKCICGFCKACIKKHFGKSELKEVKNNENWTCYFCNPKPLWYLRSICFLARKAAKTDHPKTKEGRSLEKKRGRKGVNERNGNLVTPGVSNDESIDASTSSTDVKQKRSQRHREKVSADETSSSDEDVKVNLKRRIAKSKNQSSKEDTNSSDSSAEIPTKKMKTDIDDFKKKKLLVLEKLRSIWVLTQSVMEAGLTSSRRKLRHLSRSCNFKTLESLKKEHEDLKSYIDVLATSINSASNSVNAIKDDLMFDTAKNETEIIQSQEMKLKTVAKKNQKQLHSETSADSDANTSQNELPEKETTGDAEKEGRKERVRGTKRKSDEDSEEEDERGKIVSGSETEKRDADEDDGKQEEDRDSEKDDDLVKPMLKVKSFAKMLNDNVYDNDKEKDSVKISNEKMKSPTAVEVYSVDSSDSENEKEKRTKGSGKKGRKEPSPEDRKEKRKNSSDDEKKNTSETSEREQEQEKDGKDENVGKQEKKARRKEQTGGVEKEEWKKSNKEDTADDKSETAKETALADEERPEKESPEEGEKQAEMKKEKDSSKSSEEEDIIRNTRKRNSSKAQSSLKSSFERFKKKRERYLRSTKQSKNDEEKVKETNVLDSSESGSDNEKKEKRKNWRPKKKPVLASSDEENGGKAKETKSSEEEGEEAKKSEGESSEEADENKSGEEGSEKENQRKSDAVPSSGTTSEEEFDTRKRKRIRKRKEGSSDSGEDEGKKKRKKKKKGSSSDSSEDEENKKNKKGRKNIKKILKKDSLQLETKEALKNEEERKKRLKEKQKLFEELFPTEGEEKEKKSRRLILDFDPETKEPLVTIHKKLAKRLKPHQIKGVKFMWDSCFESVQKLEEESGSGCILAHCMGLGKTLQVVTLVHTVMTHNLGVNSVLIVCPLSTVSNWIHEFEKWLGNIHTDPITLFDLVKYKKADERRMYLQQWHKEGGVLVISYDLFRNLTKSLMKQQKTKKKTQKKIQAAFESALLDPGPDLVVCDEGHLLKNDDTALSKCMNRVKTARRIVLTGTPLQNNLIEYHCMVQFVKPNILGTRKEFCNRFVNPINNGQFEDSTDLDVKIMKRRSHVLHSMLEGCIQRFDYSVLTPFLPEKHEYVIQIALTETQAKVYLHFINNLSAKFSGSTRAASLFNDYHSLQRIWTHPRTLLMQKEREDQKEALASDSEGSLKDFVVGTDEETSKDSGSDSSDDSEPEVIRPGKRVLRSNANDPEVRKMIEEEEKQQSRNWWDEFYDEKAYDDLREGNKLVLLFALLKYCREVKDKVLVFSQSLYSLDLIEYFLAKIDENGEKNKETLCGHQDNWILGSDYFRLDGSTSSETRRIWCKKFNEESNSRGRLFLISTRAGGLGINLYGANRVVVFDASWNPSHDLQSIFRVYRFGQKKTCYIYRFLSEATMEEKIYERQVTKLSLAHRVVDEHQIERHYTMGNLQDLYTFEPTPKDGRKVPNLPKDSVFAELLANHKDVIVGYHEHDSLLENKQEEELSEEERKAAWAEYEEEKVRRTYNTNVGMQYNAGAGMPYNLWLQQQILQMQQQAQMQAQQQKGDTAVRFINPAHLGHIRMNPNLVTPMHLQSNVPLEVFERGLRMGGMTPLPMETLDSFMQRISSRETCLSPEVID